jgi:class 3 adenylate cyclase
LVLLLVPLWVICFALAVRTQLEAGGLALIGLSGADSGRHPALTGEFASEYASDPLVDAGLQAGDVLVRAGDTDLSGVGTLAFQRIARDEAGRNLDVPLVYERSGETRETTLALVPVSVARPWLAASFFFAASALVLLFRARATLSVRAYFLAAFFVGIRFCVFEPFFEWVWIYVIANALYFPLLLRFFQIFPDDVAPSGRWQNIWPWLFSIQGLFEYLNHVAGRFTLGDAGIRAAAILGLVAIVTVFTRKYRRMDPVARRQMKWVLFGAYCVAVPMAVTSAITVVEPRLTFLVYLSYWATPLFPAALVVAVVRFNLFDVDRLLSAAASYNVVLVLLGAGALVAMPRAAEAASSLLGIGPGTGQFGLSLLLAGAVVPAHRRLRPEIDKLFFRQRYVIDRGIAELLPTLADCQDTRALTQCVGEGLHELLRPEACVVYARVDESFVPVFVEGRGVPPAFSAISPLIVTLAQRRQPLTLGESGRHPDEAPVSPFDRAALATLGAELVVPVRQDDSLAAFICLGRKQFGDVYTSTDLSLLMAVAETVAREQRRFDQDEIIREARDMQDSLRRYVPGAIAEQLSSGAELTSSEREVTVLFVDIRGYTGFSENRRAEEIFSTVNRYTAAVSQIVQEHSGSVVEFNGDGMMAVFGAPRALDHKERAAVEAGREIVAAVAALTFEDDLDGQIQLAVGVGIATGMAFVGNIQAVDRLIWSAIGNTTNLAARLQSLTRDLNAALVIDVRTWERAQPAAADFVKQTEVPIRGRRMAQDLYALPIQAGS